MLSKAVVIHRILRLEFLCIGRQQARVSTRNGKLSFAYTGKNPKGRFMVCSEHFNEDCFKRLFHMEGNIRRLEPGSIPTVWRKSEKSVDQTLSHRSHRKVRIECCYYFILLAVFGLYSVCPNCKLF